MTQEKKYIVESFSAVTKALDVFGAQRGHESTSTHYYAQVSGNNVVKLVESPTKCEIHELSESGGRFELTKRIPVPNVKTGLEWLGSHGFHKVSVVRMRHFDWKLGDGIVGLYVINDALHSVILEYSAGRHEGVARELGLDGAETIEQPYNKYLQARGELEPVRIETLM
jgi:hypothetical protein